MVVKLIRAHSGCLGIRRRWRTRQTAICFGEQQVCFDPKISEWGNSLTLVSILEWIHRTSEGNLVNWNILVTRGEERKIDYLSSGERNGNSPNQSLDWGCRTLYTELQNFLIAECSGKDSWKAWKPRKRNHEISWVYPEYGGTRGILSESTGTIP